MDKIKTSLSPENISDSHPSIIEFAISFMKLKNLLGLLVKIIKKNKDTNKNFKNDHELLALIPVSLLTVINNSFDSEPM